MKIIVAGNGKVGLALTKKLTTEGHDLTLIDINEKVIERSVELYDVMAVQGNCATMSVLLQAGVKKADILIAATGADELNLLCCMTAHGLNPNIHTISRIKNPEYSDQILRMRDVFALSLTFNPEKQAATEIERLIRFPGFLRRDSFAKGKVEIVELRVNAGSKLCNASLTDLNSIIKCKVLICAVLREKNVIIPSGGFVLREGDRIFVTAPTSTLSTLLDNLGIISHKVRKMIICGGGGIGFYLASQLQKNGIEVKVIEKDRELCISLANLLPNLSVVNGDASSQALLDSENLADCDCIVTLTGMDEVNMIISLYAQKKGVPQVITKVGHNKNAKLQDELAIGSIVCPKELCSNNIVRYIRAMKNKTGAAKSVHSMADGHAEALEFLVEDSTMHRGEPLKSIKLKKNLLISCITRVGDTVIPDGDSTFEKGDTVIVVAATDDIVIHQLNDIFA